MIARSLKETLKTCNFTVITRAVVVCDRNEARSLSDFKRAESIVTFLAYTKTGC